MTSHSTLFRDTEDRREAQRQRMLTTPLGRAVAQDIATMPIDELLPAAPTFDAIAVELGVELWPLPEFSHRQFLRDRDHAKWLIGFSRFDRILRVADLEHPYEVRPTNAAEETPRYIGACGLCRERTTKRKSPAAAAATIVGHLRNKHAWTPPSQLRQGW